MADEVDTAAEFQRVLVESPTAAQLATSIGIDWGARGSYEYRIVSPEDARTAHLKIDGKHIDHVDDDAFGRWLYRP
jgi:hypothetical protein